MAKARRQIDMSLPGIIATQLPPAATNDEIDAGTETGLRSFSPANILRMLRGLVRWQDVTGKPALAPSNAEQNVQSDWNATSGDAFIRNKPSISLAWQNSAGVTQTARIHTIRVN